MTGLIRATSVAAIAFRLSPWTYAIAARPNLASFLMRANNPRGINSIFYNLSNGFISMICPKMELFISFGHKFLNNISPLFIKEAKNARFT